MRRCGEKGETGEGIVLPWEAITENTEVMNNA